MNTILCLIASIVNLWFDRESNLDLNYNDRFNVSYYGRAFDGKLTANGEIYHMDQLTCASPTLPFGTIITLEHDGNLVTVRVNDRGPYAVDAEGNVIYPLRPHPTRKLDLSQASFQILEDSLSKGIIEVIVRSIDAPRNNFRENQREVTDRQYN